MEIPMQEPGAGLRTAGYSGAARRLRSGLQQKVRNVRLAWRVILVGLLISFAGILWLSQTSTIVGLGYDMQKIDKKVIELNREAEILQTQVAAFENPQRVEEEAKSKLGMVPATKFVYVKVPPTETQSDSGRDNPKLYPVNNWWRELTEMLPKPWQNSAPSESSTGRSQGSGSNGQ